MDRLTGTLSQTDNLVGRLSQGNNLNGSLSNVASEGTRNYNKLNNKPTINAVTIEGDKVSADYKLQGEISDVTESDIDNIIYG